MRGLIVVAAILVVCTPVRYSRAEPLAFDTVPAATLLLPYFEVSLGEEPGVNTVLRIRNTNSAATIAHIVLFTDFRVPTLFFNVPLAAFQSYELDLRALFAGEVLPLGESTETSGTSAPLSEDALFESGFESGDILEWTASIASPSRQTIGAYHSGGVSVREGLIASFDHGDSTARGYVTVDTVNPTSLAHQDVPGYFGTGGASTFDNFLSGEFEIRDDVAGVSVKNPLVHVEAMDGAFSAGDYTFYGPFVDGLATDQREPLFQRWRSRFETEGLFDGTDLIYWRDPKGLQYEVPMQPGMTPEWFPLGYMMMTVFDEAGNGVEVPSLPGIVPTPFPLACGRVSVGGEEIPVDTASGWIEVNFGNIPTSGIYFDREQAYLMSLFGTGGAFSAGNSGMPTDSP